METAQTVRKKSNKRLVRFLLGAGIVLLIPVILQITIGTGVDGQGFNWKLNDFIIMGFLLFGTVLSCEFVLQNVKKYNLRLLLCLVILLTLVLIWIDLAVGIFNIPGFSGS